MNSLGLQLDINKRIIVVDDNDLCALYASEMLLAAGWQVESVNSGQSAIQSVGEFTYDFMILDWYMPLQDGGSTLRQMDQVLELKKESLPFVVYSGQDLSDIDLPFTKNLVFVDFWRKGEIDSQWEAKLRSFLRYWRG